MIFWLIPIAFLLLYLVYKIKLYHTEKCAANIPGDKSLPFIGNAAAFFRVKCSADIWDVVYNIIHKYEEYGILKFWFGPVFGVGIWSPEYIEVIANHPAAGNKSQIYSMIFEDILQGMFVSETSPKYKELRKPFLKTITKKSIDGEYHDVFVRRSNDFVEYIKEKHCGQEFNVLHLVSNLLIDIFSETHLGVYINEVRENRFKYLENFDAFLEVTLSAILKYHFYFWRIRTKFSRLGKTLESSVKEVTRFHQWVLDERKKCVKYEDEFYSDFIVRRAAEKKLPVTEPPKELGDVIIGGSDTSSVITASALVFLAMFPEIQEEAYMEQMSIFGDSSRDPTSEDLASMCLLTRIVKETLRLVSSPAILKTCTDDIPLDKYIIPKGTILYLAIQKVHRDARYWEKPEQFYPNHFLPEKEAARPRYAYFPFGCGPRICPGFLYGLSVTRTILSALIRNFKFTTSMKYEDIVYDYKLLLQIKSGYHVKFEERNKS